MIRANIRMLELKSAYQHALPDSEIAILGYNLIYDLTAILGDR
jgi:hypothetical protein